MTFVKGPRGALLTLSIIRYRKITHYTLISVAVIFAHRMSDKMWQGRKKNDVQQEGTDS